MDQLGNKIKEAIEANFQVKLTSFSMTREADMWGMNFGNPSAHYKVSLVVVNSKHKLLDGTYPSHDIQKALRDGIFDDILNDSGRLISMSTNVSNSSFRTDLQFITHDIVAFANALHDFGWKAYSNEFDALMTSTLSED